jgi:aldose 1-epimerase
MSSSLRGPAGHLCASVVPPPRTGDGKLALGTRRFPTDFHAVQTDLFGKTPTGESVTRFTLTNRHGLVARLITWGAGLVEMHAPDRHGALADVTLGFDTLAGYLTRHPYFGVTTGRYANRIAGGKFTLDGTTCSLATNDGAHHLHGGVKALDQQNWRGEAGTGESVRFSLISPDGDEGYPGTLHIAVTYSLTEDDELRLDYEATTDRPTVLNLTNHAYWNLAGAGAGDILGHALTLHARSYTPVGAGSIPTGEIAPVAGGPLDFTRPKLIAQDFAQMTGSPGGYDHNFILTPATPGALTLAAEARDPQSGRVLTIATTEPGIQFYTGNYLDGSVIGKGGTAYRKNAGFCLETQHFPDSPNHPHFPSTVLRPGQTFRSSTVHRFSAR